MFEYGSLKTKGRGEILDFNVLFITLLLEMLLESKKERLIKEKS